jgi:hypothetical protein
MVLSVYFWSPSCALHKSNIRKPTVSIPASRYTAVFHKCRLFMYVPYLVLVIHGNNFSKHSTVTFSHCAECTGTVFWEIGLRMVQWTETCCQVFNTDCQYMLCYWLINYCIVNRTGWLLSKRGNICDIIMQIAGLLLMTFKPYHAITSVQNTVVIWTPDG